MSKVYDSKKMLSYYSIKKLPICIFYRFLLNDYSSEVGLYLGHRFKSEYVNQGYMSGGAGYVLSKKALHQ